MVCSNSYLVKIGMSEASRRCGNCNSCMPYEILVWPKDMATLKASAKAILEAELGGPLLKSEHLINLLVLGDKLRQEKIRCGQQHCTVSFLEPACSLWQPRHAASSQ